VKGNKKAISRKISEFAVNLKYEYLPDNVVEQTERFLYDSIKCAFGNVGTKDVNIFEKYLEYPIRRSSQTDEYKRFENKI